MFKEAWLDAVKARSMLLLVRGYSLLMPLRLVVRTVLYLPNTTSYTSRQESSSHASNTVLCLLEPQLEKDQTSKSGWQKVINSGAYLGFEVGVHFLCACSSYMWAGARLNAALYTATSNRTVDDDQ